MANNAHVSSAGRVERGGAFQPVRVMVNPLDRGRGADRMLVVSFTEREGQQDGRAVEVE